MTATEQVIVAIGADTYVSRLTERNSGVEYLCNNVAKLLTKSVFHLPEIRFALCGLILTLPEEEGRVIVRPVSLPYIEECGVEGIIPALHERLPAGKCIYERLEEVVGMGLTSYKQLINRWVDEVCFPCLIVKYASRAVAVLV